VAVFEATPGVRMNVLIRRRASATRDELVANWFANHMPAVVRAMAAQALAGRSHAHRYIATLFEPDAQGHAAWDGIAQLWWKESPPKPDVPHGTKPADTFQQKAEPYMPWMVRETVVLDGALPSTPNTLNDPFPFTRSGFYKKTFLLKTLPGVDRAAFFRHWLEVHAPLVREHMQAHGGFRYVIGQSLEPEADAFAGIAEFWFPDAASWERHWQATVPDGMERFVDPGASLSFTSGTEMVGIPG
jgi:hypothetical protein